MNIRFPTFLSFVGSVPGFIAGSIAGSGAAPAARVRMAHAGRGLVQIGLVSAWALLPGCGDNLDLPATTEEEAPAFIDTAPLDLPLVRRSVWTDFVPADMPASSTWQRIILHQTGTYLAEGQSCGQAVRSVLAQHTEQYGLPDIGFHFLVCPDGTVYEGTYGGKHARGYHFLRLQTATGTPDPDTLALSEHALGIAFVGQFSYANALAVNEQGELILGEDGSPVLELDRPTPRAVEAAARLVAWVADAAEIDLSGAVDGAALTVSSYRGEPDATPYPDTAVIPNLSYAYLHFEQTGGRVLVPSVCTAEEIAAHTQAGRGACKDKQPGDRKGAGYMDPPLYLEMDGSGEEIALITGEVRDRALARQGRKDYAIDRSAPIVIRDAVPSSYVPEGFTRPALGIEIRRRSEYARYRNGDTLPEGAQVGDVIPFDGTPEIAAWKRVTLHHTALSTDDFQPGDCAAYVEEVFRGHRFGNRWSDIGYNFVICPDGTVFAGRNDGIKDTRGAQNFGYNRVTAGVNLLGQMSSAAAYEPIGGRMGLNPPTREALEATGKLIAWLSVELDAPLDELLPGTEVITDHGVADALRPRMALPFIGWHQLYGTKSVGHGDWQNEARDYYYHTLCPGDAQLESVGYIRAVAEAWRAVY